MCYKGGVAGVCINRNIVECKDPCYTFPNSLIRVLIETLWKVKYKMHQPVHQHQTVLIETLWNVKKNMYTAQRMEYYVLIETLWNVKIEPMYQNPLRALY